MKNKKQRHEEKKKSSCRFFTRAQGFISHFAILCAAKAARKKYSAKCRRRAAGAVCRPPWAHMAGHGSAGARGTR